MASCTIDNDFYKKFNITNNKWKILQGGYFRCWDLIMMENTSLMNSMHIIPHNQTLIYGFRHTRKKWCF